MATIVPQPVGKSNTKHHAVKIDMTPLVDLGFLLITFFIFTATLTQPTVTKLVMPKADPSIEQAVYEKTLLTAVLAKDKAFVYEGAFDKALAQNGFRTTTYNPQTGLGELIRQKQKRLKDENLQDKLLVVLKPLPSSSYQNLISALDEMLINSVGRYSVAGASEKEKAYLDASER